MVVMMAEEEERDGGGREVPDWVLYARHGERRERLDEEVVFLSWRIARRIEVPSSARPSDLVTCSMSSARIMP